MSKNKKEQEYAHSLKKKKENLASAVDKLIRAKNLGSDCRLTADECAVIHEVLTQNAVNISRIMKDYYNAS